MKFPLCLLAAASALLLAPPPLEAAVPLLNIDISPMSGALNAGANPYTRDHGIGLSGLNEPGMFTMVGSGNEIGGGITYDDSTNNLAFDFAYGSAFGFTDLAGNFSAVHFHAPGLVNFPAANTNGSVIQNLGSFHTPSGTQSGRVTGSIILDATNEAHLFNNEIYINIHSSVQGGGEIRGQLIPIPEPGSAFFLTAASALILRRRRN